MWKGVFLFAAIHSGPVPGRRSTDYSGRKGGQANRKEVVPTSEPDSGRQNDFFGCISFFFRFNPYFFRENALHEPENREKPVFKRANQQLFIHLGIRPDITKFASLESLNTTDIELLVNRLKTGDQVAFAEMYDRYSGAINGVIARVVRDTEASQDVLQDTFVKVWKNIQSYDSTKGSFFTWMLNIARNTSIDSLRKLKKEGKTEIQNWDKTVGVEGAVQQNINSIGLSKLVEKLPAEQRLMIEYIYFNGYTQQEVADELEMPLGTVKTRTRLAMRELRKWFTLLVLWM